MKTMIEKARQVGKAAVFVAGLAAVLLVGAVDASDAEAKKKKPNVVQCADEGFECVGTSGKDLLVGTPGAENILGKGGNDVYEANGGNTFLFDSSAKSSDSYTNVDPGAGRNTVMFDSGGSDDFLDMGSFETGDVTFIRFNNGVDDDDELTIRGPEFRDFDIDDHFGRGRIEKIKFADKTIKGKEIESLVREAAPEERAALEQSLDESSTQEKE